MKQSDSLVYFVTVDPYVLSLKVLFVCYCDHAASVQERLPGEKPCRRSKETSRDSIQDQGRCGVTNFQKRDGFWTRMPPALRASTVRLSRGPTHRSRCLSKQNARRHCYSTVNSLNASLRAICIVANDTWLWSKRFW